MIDCIVLMPVMSERSEARVTERAVELFGGCSWLPNEVTGAWRHPDTGEVIREPMERLLICVESLSDFALVVAYARETGIYLDEHTMMVSALGLSEMVRCRRAAVEGSLDDE